MSNKSRKQTKGDNNPYEKVFDDSQRKLNKLGDFDYLKDIPNITDREPTGIPFPYGGTKTSSYNCN